MTDRYEQRLHVDGCDCLCTDCHDRVRGCERCDPRLRHG